MRRDPFNFQKLTLVLAARMAKEICQTDAYLVLRTHARPWVLVAEAARDSCSFMHHAASCILKTCIERSSTNASTSAGSSEYCTRRSQLEPLQSDSTPIQLRSCNSAAFSWCRGATADESKPAEASVKNPRRCGAFARSLFWTVRLQPSCNKLSNSQHTSVAVLQLTRAG